MSNEETPINREDWRREYLGILPKIGIERLSPPMRDFFAKRVLYEGIPIMASEHVEDLALLLAYARLERLLGHIPRITSKLRDEGVELHIIGRNEVTSDLPENREWKGKPFDGEKTIDERTRGVGGKYCSCGEENLMGLEPDRYADRDICIHEFTHAIFELGLSDRWREKVEAQYHRSLERGLWRTAYASTNPNEFLAELTMWYFGTKGDIGKMSPAPKAGREGLRDYDPEAYQLLKELYEGEGERI
jgi:hypothetical protein